MAKERGVSDLAGVVLRSNGKYEPDHWYHCLIKDTGNGYDCFDVNNFNINHMTYEEISLGYVQVPPIGAFVDIEDFADSLNIAIDRWIKNT